MFDKHCAKSVCIQSFSGPNEGKYGPAKTPNTDTFYAVKVLNKPKECHLCILYSANVSNEDNTPRIMPPYIPAFGLKIVGLLTR